MPDGGGGGYGLAAAAPAPAPAPAPASSASVARLQDINAHEKPVNCLCIGRKTGNIIASGGDDKKVNIWSLGRPQALRSLSDKSLTAPVQSVQFDGSEEVVVAGTSSGTIKLWDLDTGKGVRTLLGHKAGVKSLDFHPYGEFVASGSCDTNLKVWDVRRKGCIQTYKGHSGIINTLKFSPDGRWVVSGADDGLIKLWDLTAGKMIDEFSSHKGAVSTLEFHPNEFLLASGGADRVVRYFDLENFTEISTNATESNKIKSIAFHPEGLALYSCSNDMMRSYGWEPPLCYDVVQTGWGKVADIYAKDTPDGVKLVAGSFSSTSPNHISVWVADLDRLGKIGDEPYEAKRSGTAPLKEKKQNTRAVAPIHSKPPVKAAHKAPSISERAAPAPAPAPASALAPSRDAAENSNPQSQVPPRRAQLDAPVPVQRPATSAKSSKAPQSERPPTAATSTSRPATAATTSRPATGQAAKNKLEESADIAAVLVPAERDAPLGLNISDFVPKPVKDINKETHAITPAEVLKTIETGHNSMTMVLSSRLQHLKVVRSLWARGKLKEAFFELDKMQDQGALVDLLNVMKDNPKRWTLEVAKVALPHLKPLIVSQFEQHIRTALNTLKIVLGAFGAIILQNIEYKPSRGMKDIASEERFERCFECHRHLREAKLALSKLAKQRGLLGSEVREILAMLTRY